MVPFITFLGTTEVGNSFLRLHIHFHLTFSRETKLKRVLQTFNCLSGASYRHWNRELIGTLLHLLF